MLRRSGFLPRMAIRFILGLAVVSGIGWLTDRTEWSTSARLGVDIVVIGLVLGLFFPGPLTYGEYVDREHRRNNRLTPPPPGTPREVRNRMLERIP